jgi:hypothetical protein
MIMMMMMMKLPAGSEKEIVKLISISHNKIK